VAVCRLCGVEMTTGRSCTVEALHVGGRRVVLARFGRERRGRRGVGARCGDCGVARGGYHHLGCDLQPCPVCRGAIFSCGCRFDEDGDGDSDDGCWDVGEPVGVDGNGVLVERVVWAGGEVLVRHQELPESDITMVRGIRCTTALRTVIDLAAELDAGELPAVVSDALARRLFTVEEAWQRLEQPDLARHSGALRLGQILPPPG
jgi:hypothetical protein